MDTIRKIFVLPPAKNEYEKQSARVLQVILAFFGCASIAYSVLNIVTDYPNLGRYAAQGGILLAFMLIGLIFLRKGHLRLIASMEILVIWLVFTAAAYTGGGVISSGYFGYLVVLVVAGVISGRRLDTVIVAIFCAGAGYYFVYAAAHGLLPPSRVPLTPLAFWIDSLIFFAIITGLLILTMRVTYNALLRVNDELLERRCAEAREQNRREMLEKVIHLGKLVTEVADYRTVLLRIWNGIRADLGFDRVGLFIYDASHNTMRGSFGTDRNGNFVEEWHLEFPASGDDFFAGVLSRPDSYLFTSDYEKERNLRPKHIMAGVKYYAAVSAWAGDKPVALICVDQLTSGRQITEEQLEALRLFAGYAGLAIQNARLNSELERRVLERTAQLEAANKELEAFSYSVSHDLRAPLRSINGFSKILNDDFAAELSPLARNFLQKIISSGEKMGQLIDKLLDFSRVGRKELALRAVDMNALVQIVIESLMHETANRQIEWTFGELPAANADPALIQQVYANLIGNAVKYSRNREQARIEIGSTSQNGEAIYFVHDNGAGFDMQYAGKLFGVFQRLHRDDEFEGAGIGLAIIRRIIERHGGRVWAEAEVDKGATFYFTLPMERV